MSACVIDASAVLAYLFGERGEDEARLWMDRGAAISTANVQEVMAKLIDRGTSREEARTDVELLALDVADLTLPDAEEAAAMVALTKPLGLRACLAKRGVWSALSLGVGSCVAGGMRAPYPSSLTDAQRAQVRHHLPELAGGRRRRWPPRLVVDAMLYLVRTGCQRRQLARDFPPWQTVYHHHRRWDGRGLLHRLHEALRRAVRLRRGRARDASAAVMDSQSVRTTQAGGVRGLDGGKGVRGRKRHLLVDTEGLVLSQDLSAAHVSDQAGARRLLSGLRPLQPRLELIWADGAHAGHPLSSWAAERGIRIEVVRREEGQRGFAVQPRRWVVERTFAWLGRSRRLAKDHERRLQSAEAFIKLAMIHLMLQRLA